MAFELEHALRALVSAAFANDEEWMLQIARAMTPGEITDARDLLSQVTDALAIADARDA